MDTRKFILENLKNAKVAPEEITAEANFIIENYLKINNYYDKIECSEDQILFLKSIFQQRKKGIPLQYILGISDFMGEKFVVNKNVLIPRPETEILVSKCIEKAQNFFTPKILDIGTGSGCISIILSKKIPNAQIFASDISPNALKIAQINSKNLKSKVIFIKSDMFKNINMKFDIIISNPPYIPLAEKANIQKEVQLEPKTALFTRDKNGIKFYKKIIKNGANFLNTKGYILFELGIGQSELVKKIFMDYNYEEIEITKDLDNIDRIISAKVKNG